MLIRKLETRFSGACKFVTGLAAIGVMAYAVHRILPKENEVVIGEDNRVFSNTYDSFSLYAFGKGPSKVMELRQQLHELRQGERVCIKSYGWRNNIISIVK